MTSVFNTVQDRMSHLLSVHNITPALAPTNLYKWCPYCEDFIWATHNSHEFVAHFTAHLPDAIADVRMYGYNKFSMCTRPVVQACCIFCLHDVTKPPQSRLQLCAPDGTSNAGRLRSHLWLHIEALDQHSHHYCPASATSGTDIPFCTHTESMKIKDLQTHLEKTHELASAAAMESANMRLRKKRKKSYPKEAAKRKANKHHDEKQVDSTLPLQSISTDKRLRPTTDKGSQETDTTKEDHEN